MTDLHCHILPDIDDGPSELDESVALCRIALNNHITKITATPHIMDISKTDAFLARRDQRIGVLKQELDRQEIEIELFPGAEVFVTDDIFYVDGLEKLVINHSRYLLAEFPYSGLDLNTLMKYVAEIQGQGMVPIVAHPERYDYFQREYEMINILAQEGVLFQVNADSLLRSGGKKEYKLAKEMVKQGVASFLATDAHSVHGRANNLFEMIYAFPPEIRDANMDELVNINPELVLQNRDVEPGGRELRKRKWGG